jgi:hypothetical protein
MTLYIIPKTRITLAAVIPTMTTGRMCQGLYLPARNLNSVYAYILEGSLPTHREYPMEKAWAKIVALALYKCTDCKHCRNLVFTGLGSEQKILVAVVLNVPMSVTGQDRLRPGISHTLYE